MTSYGHPQAHSKANLTRRFEAAQAAANIDHSDYLNRLVQRIYVTKPRHNDIPLKISKLC